MPVKRIILVFGIIILSGINFQFHPPQDPYKIKVVVIDAGHGGHDPGALGKHAKEKDIALAIALKTGKYIEDNFKDVKVIYTRKTDVFIKLWRRAQIANENHADLFISIHCNANDNPKPHGTETWIMGLHKSKANLAVAQKENAAILLEKDHEEKYNNFNPNSPKSYIAFSLYQSAFRDQSIDFATKVESEFKNRAKRYDRGVKEAGFLVLWKTAMTSVLIETGFVSNPNEEKYLMSESGQNNLASSIYRAFKAYKKEMEGENYVAPQKQEVKPKQEIKVEQPKEKPKEKPKEEVVSKEDANQVEIVFGVQFATTKEKKPSSAAVFKGMENVWNYYHSGYYKYVTGKYSSLDDAVANLKKVRDKGFSDAFVVAFKDGKRIAPKEAMKIISQSNKK